MINEMSVLKNMNYIRVGGSKEELKCAEYLCKELKTLGLKPRIETFPIQASQIKEVSLEVTKPYKKKIKCKAYACASNAKNLIGELYYYRGKNNETCHDVKDKIVLFDKGLPYWSYKDLIDQKAKGFIVCNGNLINDNTDIDERELRKPLRELGELPGVAINVSEAFEMIQNGAKEVKLTTLQKETKGESRNVVCEIKGESDETIVFTAHYDSTALSNGVYDNATGSVAILKVCEYYAKHKPKHNLVFVWCGSEEKGLLGSKAYCLKHKKQLEKYKLCINVDMIGTAMGGFLACSTAEEKLVGYVEYMSKEVGFSIHSYQGVYSSDSTPFADNGVPAISFARITNLSPIHCRYDQINMINKDIMKEDCNFILEFSKRMADAKFIPVNREIPKNMKEELDYYLLRKEKNESNSSKS